MSTSSKNDLPKTKVLLVSSSCIHWYFILYYNMICLLLSTTCSIRRMFDKGTDPKIKNDELWVYFTHSICTWIPSFHHFVKLKCVYGFQLITFLGNFILEPYWWLTIETCKTIDNSPYENLAKSGYKPNMK
jgi:hypothetical protein